MWPFIRVIVSLVVSFELAFGSLLGGGFSKVIEPEMKPAGEYSQWVDPFIGTGGTPWTCAMLSPAATAPFGNVRLGPDTCFMGGTYIFKTNTSGYYYEQRHIRGFSHGRLSGTGVEDNGDFRVTPRVSSGEQVKNTSSALPYSHANEWAAPGYYAVYLPTVSCLAELTATDHAGLHRYTFNTSKNAHLIIDTASYIGPGETNECEISVDAENGIITGKAVVRTGFAGRYDGLPVYMYAVTDTPIVNLSTSKGGEKAGDKDAVADLCFGNLNGKTVNLRVGVSNISFENAKLNLEEEVGAKSFDDVRAETAGKWEERLSSVKITSASDEIKRVFYTSLYHTMIMPTDFTDVNGEYLGFDKKTSVAEGFTYRTDMSLWDTARNTHSLYTLIAPDVQLDCLKSLVCMAEAGGVLPRWPSGAGYTGSMFGTPADIVIAESYLKGMTDFDVETAYEYMKQGSEKMFPGKDSRDGLEAYNELGYCALDDVDKSVSRTLEYAWEDAAIASLAEALGKEDDAAYYREKSMNYVNVFDPDTKYFRGRNLDGSWGPLMPNFTTFYDEVLIKKVSKAYAEGSARQWRWCVEQDVPGLIELFGSKEYFVSELEDFMEDATANRAALNPGAGYWLGNQHDIHTPYLFNDADRADLAQKWVRWSLSERFSDDVNGLDGNDDGGTVSAWYVFSSMGFYPVAGSDRYWLGSPCVDSAELALDGGKVLKVKAVNQSAENIYVQSVTLNGQRLTEPFITHSQIADGGELVFTMGSAPAVNGGY